MAVPYTFATATSSIPLSQLDSNFATTITLGNTAIQLGNTVTTLNNMTLANVSISSGNVTFGNVTATTANVTTANVTTLEVYSHISITEAALTPAVGSFIYRPGSNQLAFGTASTERIRIGSDGNVGLQTTSASNYTAVDANNLVIGTNSGTNGLTVVSGNTSNGNLAFADGIGTGGASDYAGMVQYDHSADNMNFFTGATERMRLNSSGLTLNGGTANGVAYLNGSKVLTTGSALTFDGTNLGVGTATPTFAAGTGLQVKGAGFTSVRVTGGALTGTDLSQDASGGYLYVRDNLPLIFGVNNAEQMRLTSTGLGIGTSSLDAAFKLGVYGSNSGAVFQNSNTGATSSDGFAVGNFGNTTAYVYNYEAAPLVFGTNGTEQMRLDSSGNLGLGVTPSAWANSKAFDIGAYGALSTDTLNDANTSLSWNAYATAYNAWKYKNTGSAASRYAQEAGKHYWYTAASGTAGNAITFTQAMTLDASGNLGVGTTSTSYRMEVVGPSGDNIISLFRSGDATAANNAGGGFRSISSATAASRVAQLWLDADGADLSGGDYFYIQKNGNSGTVDIVQYSNAAMTFSTNTTERARITSGGDLLVGTTTTTSTVDVGFRVLGNRPVCTLAASTDVGATTYEVYSTGAAAYRFYVGLGGTVYATNTTISAISDQRLKENIRDLDVGLNSIMALKPRKFDWKAGKGKDKKDDRGFIAQEFEQVFPDLIDEWKDPAPEGEEPYKAVRADLIPVLVKAMQEQQAMINELKAKVAALEAK